MRRIKIDDEVAQTDWRIFPLNVVAKRSTESAAQILSTEIRWITKDTVKTAALNDLGKLQKPVKETLLDRGSPSCRSSLGPVGGAGRIGRVETQRLL